MRATGQINVDEVISLEPDLIVATPSIDELDLARAGRRSGAAVYVQPDTSILNVEQGTIDLGFLVGEAPRARRLVGRIEQKVEDIQRRLATVAPVKVFIDTGFFITVPERSLLGDLVRKAKGESVAGPTPGPGPFPLADLARLNPAVYLATSDAGVTLAALRETRRSARSRPCGSGGSRGARRSRDACGAPRRRRARRHRAGPPSRCLQLAASMP